MTTERVQIHKGSKTTKKYYFTNSVMVHLRVHGSNSLTKILILYLFSLESISAGEEMQAFTEKIKQNTHQKHPKNNKLLMTLPLGTNFRFYQMAS